jgi:hypothetical protein
MLLSVDSWKTKLLGLILILSVVLSVYASFVYVVDGVIWHEFVESVSLSNGHSSKSVSTYNMGDLLVISAKMRGANAYFVRIYDGNCSVFEESGMTIASEVNVHILICPPAFKGGKVYSLVFQGGLINSPVVGLVASSSSVAAFSVAKSLTQLDFSSIYGRANNELSLAAFLSAYESAPVANRTIGFYLQPQMDLPMQDRGWIHLGSARTDEKGLALLHMGINIMSGCHALEARFAGDDEFEPSFNDTSFTTESVTPRVRIVKIEKNEQKVNLVLRVTDDYDFPLAGRVLMFDFLNIRRSVSNVISDQTGYATLSLSVDNVPDFIDSKITVLEDGYTSRLQTTARLNFTRLPSFAELNGNNDQTFGSKSDSGSANLLGEKAAGIGVLVLGNVAVTLTPSPGRADLPVTVKAKFSSYDQPYEGSKFKFYLDGTTLKGTVTASIQTVLVHYPDVYRYDHTAELLWQPDYWGNYAFLVKFLDAYNTVVAQGSASSNVQPAPANLVVYYSEAFRGDSLNLSIAFSGPRTYEAPNQTDLFQISRLVPFIVWGGVTYALDRGVNATPIHVFVNGSQVVDVLSSSETVSSALVPLNFSGNYVTMNIRVATDDLSRYHEVVERNCTLTKVSVLNIPSGGNDLLKLNFSLGESNLNNQTYICSDTLIEAKASIFGLPLDNVVATIIGGKIEARSATNASGWVSIPQGCNLLRVKSACSLRDDMASPLADVNLDGIVDDIDFNQTHDRIGSVFGSRLYDWRFDLNADGRINETDTDIINTSLGKYVEYLDFGSYNYNSTIVDFDNGTRGSLDSQGFTTIPPEATWLNVSIGGIVEFFDWTLFKHPRTNNIGIASTEWCPQQANLYVLRVDLPPSFDVVMELQSNVTHLDADLSLVNYVCVVKRPLDLNVTYAPSQPTLDSLITFTARLLDLGLGVPLESRCLEFYIEGNYPILMGTAYTNASGFATFSCIPRDYEDPHSPFFPNIAFTVSCPEAAETKWTLTYVHVDMRIPTKLEFLGSEVMHFHLGQQYTFTFRLTTVDGDPVIGYLVDILKDNDPTKQMPTREDGLTNYIEFNSESGTHSYWARFEGGGFNYAPSNEVKFVAVVDVVPVSILLDVQPRNFKPDAELTLSATVLNATSPNETLGQDILVTFNQIEPDGSISWTGDVPTNSSGVASKLFFYPLEGVCAFNVSVAGHPQFICSPVMLTVAKETALTMYIVKGAKDTNHTISGTLSSYAQPVPNKQVSILVNGTVRSNVTTNINGWFNLSLDFLPADNKQTTYNVQATFEGDEPSSAAAYGYTPNGTRYAVCTTTHYGYKPTSNSTILTVESRSTTTTTIKKTPEQLQQEGQAQGLIPPSTNEFTLWYPWYRLHLKIQIDSTVIDIGFNPLLPGGGTLEFVGPEIFAEIINEFIGEVMLDVMVLFAEYVTAKILSFLPITWVPALVALTIKGGTQVYLLAQDWNDRAKMLAVAFVNIIMALIACETSLGTAFINALLSIVSSGAISAMYLLQSKMIVVARPIQGTRTWLDGVEILMDLASGISALARYRGRL